MRHIQFMFLPKLWCWGRYENMRGDLVIYRFGPFRVLIYK